MTDRLLPIREIRAEVAVRYADDDGCDDACLFVLTMNADDFAAHGLAGPIIDDGERAIGRHVAEGIEVAFAEALRHRDNHRHRVETRCATCGSEGPLATDNTCASCEDGLTTD